MLTKECLHSIKNTGNLLHYIHIENGAFDLDNFISKLSSDISNFLPDFVLTINNYGLDNEGYVLKYLKSIEMPIAVWYVDSPNIVQSGKNCDSYITKFVWDYNYDGHFLPLGTDITIFHPLDLPYLYDVSFCGSSMANVVHKNIKSFLHRDDLMKEIFEETEWTSKITGKEFDNLDQQNDFFAARLYRASQRYRLKGINKLSVFSPVISGDPFWKNMLSSEFKLLPERWYYDNLCTFYNQSKINFNITSLQMPTAVNQRVFDVSACRKFLLTDYRDQVAKYFFSKENMVWYDDIEEIPDLLKFYLINDSKREEIAKHAYEIVLANHTYEHRIRELINVMQRNYYAFS